MDTPANASDGKPERRPSDLVELLSRKVVGQSRPFAYRLLEQSGLLAGGVCEVQTPIEKGDQQRRRRY